jgi:hypothetical protein
VKEHRRKEWAADDREEMRCEGNVRNAEECMVVVVEIILHPGFCICKESGFGRIHQHCIVSHFDSQHSRFKL